MPLKQLFKRNSVANLKRESAQRSPEEEDSGPDTSYYSSFPKSQNQNQTSHIDNNNTAGGQKTSDSSNYSSSPQSIVVDSFLPRIDINEEDDSFMTMDFMKKEAPLPPLPKNSKDQVQAQVQVVMDKDGEHLDPVYALNSGRKAPPPVIETVVIDGDDDDEEDDDDGTNSIQPSPVIYEPGTKEKQKFSYQSSSSTLPSQFSNNSSASSSTTVDSVTQPKICSTGAAPASRHVHTTSAISYNNPADAETARQFWTYHHAQHPSITSYAGAAGVVEDKRAEEAEQEEEEDEPLFEEGRKVESTSRVKSMFPHLSFYKPLKNPDEEYKQEKKNVEEGEDECLVAESPGSLYDGQNDSVLSFNDSSSAAEQQLEQNSLPPVDTNNASSFRKSLASPVKSLSRLTKRSSRTFSKKLVFNEANNAANVPPVPAVSIDQHAFGEAFGNDAANSSNQENAPPVPVKQVPPPAPRAPLPPQLTVNTKGSDSEDDEDDEDDNLLPLSPLAPPTRSASSGGTAVQAPNTGNKVMTKSQFDSYRKSVIESGLTSPLNKGWRGHGQKEEEEDDEEEEEEDGEEDDEYDSDVDSDDEREKKRRDKYDDELDNKKQSVRMRLKQDAHLSVYRQKMTKVTGSQTALSSYNPTVRGSTQNFGNLDQMLMDDDDEDEYDDVPLGILQAHGFPGASNKVKPSASMATFEELANANRQGPNILYQGGGETQSLHSNNSALKPGVDIRASAPPLPAVFNNTTSSNANRGLIGEIAMAEEAKMRRKSLGGMLNQRASGILASSQSVSGLATSATATNQNEPMQQQMQQMMQMQMQILQQMNGTTGTTQAPNNQLKKHWSTFDVPSTAQQSPSVLMPPPPPPKMRPSSIRSFSPSERSVQTRPMSMMPGQNYNNNRSTFAGVSGHQRNNSQPTLKDLASQEMYRMSRSQSTPYMYQQGAPSQPPQQPLQQQSRPTSMMKFVQNSYNDEDEDDEDEDDAAWEEMLRKRQGLKESWKNRGITA